MTFEDPLVVLREEIERACERCARGDGVFEEDGEYTHGCDEYASDGATFIVPPEPCPASALHRAKARLRPTTEGGFPRRLLEAALVDCTLGRVAATLGDLGPQVFTFALKQTGLTQRQLADRLHVSHHYVCRIAGGKAPLPCKLAAQIYHVLAECGKLHPTPQPAPTAKEAM